MHAGIIYTAICVNLCIYGHNYIFWFLLPGILCGECNEGMGVTVLLNICSTSCDTGYISLIPILSMYIKVLMIRY